jgi:hypothetical protein
MEAAAGGAEGGFRLHVVSMQKEGGDISPLERYFRKKVDAISKKNPDHYFVYGGQTTDESGKVRGRNPDVFKNGENPFQHVYYHHQQCQVQLDTNAVKYYVYLLLMGENKYYVLTTRVSELKRARNELMIKGKTKDAPAAYNDIFKRMSKHKKVTDMNKLAKRWCEINGMLIRFLDTLAKDDTQYGIELKGRFMEEALCGVCQPIDGIIDFSQIFQELRNTGESTELQQTVEIGISQGISIPFGSEQVQVREGGGGGAPVPVPAPEPEPAPAPAAAVADDQLALESLMAKYSSK